ncbi:ornithine carbamoyltransferase [Candidatus Woesearchaeota archaeon]|nr:ornithine carbamoyltransferase [Candidatus Woesearchaeota archaeon]MBT7366597.1 ornithine carbamoyltransferase [Candidatus Woesearchaeota archaeon]
MKKDLLDLSELSNKEINQLIDLAKDIKQNPEKYSKSLKQKTLLMIFEKPSLRTRVSFEVGMTQLGGHAIYYDIATSPMGKKESIADTAKTASRYTDIIMARLFKHEHVIELAQNASVPVINALTDFSHPCQILADLLTIDEKKGNLTGIKLSYVGDSNNNVTHSLIYGCAIMGIDVSVGCPEGEKFSPQNNVWEKAKELAQLSGSKIEITHDAISAVKNADVIYTDSWMSYHISEEEKEKRIQIFMPYQVNSELMKHAKSNAIFMNCLPAMREMEQTAEVIDGPQSVVFDQAENRLHMQNAIMIELLKK